MQQLVKPPVDSDWTELTMLLAIILTAAVYSLFAFFFFGIWTGA